MRNGVKFRRLCVPMDLRTVAPAPSACSFARKTLLIVRDCDMLTRVDNVLWSVMKLLWTRVLFLRRTDATLAYLNVSLLYQVRSKQWKSIEGNLHNDYTELSGC